jgi:phosphoribosyl-dephospho-CoA transferase
MTDEIVRQAEPEWFRWNPKWKPASVRLAYEESTKLLASQHEWLKALETKVLTVFTLTSGVITVAATLQKAVPIGWTLVVWAAALVAYIGAVIECARAYGVRSYKSDPDPKHMLVAEYLELTEEQFRIMRLRDIADICKHNRDVMTVIAKDLRLALRWAIAEVSLIAVALLLTT